LTNNTKTTITIVGFDIIDISEGLLNGPKGEFRFRVHVTKENSNESYSKTNQIIDLPPHDVYYSWDKGYHNVDRIIPLDNMTLTKGDTISVSISGREVDDADDDDTLGRDANNHEIIPGNNENYSISNEYYTMNYTISSE